MFHEMNMQNNRITKLKKPTDITDSANKNYVDKKAKGVITVWAEEVGPIAMGHAEWSFGDRGRGAAQRKSGYYIPVSGRIIRI